MAKFHHDIYLESNKDHDQKINLSVRYGQMLCLLLQTVAQGNRTGEHRLHLEAYKSLIKDSPPEDSAFLVFITEFFQYYVFADELIRHPDVHKPRLAIEDWVPWMPIEPARLIGVSDGLFHYLCQITTIRNTIRANIAAQIDPVVDYTSLYRAAEIDAAIREWRPHWPWGDGRDRVGVLYQQVMWIYLFRTIYPPSGAPPLVAFASASSSSSSSSNSMLVMHSRRVSGAASATTTTKTTTAVAPSTTPPRPPPHQPMHTPPPSERPPSSHAATTPPPPPPSSTAQRSPSRGDSPAPIRYPPHHDHRVTMAVDESLAILESFKPGDPVQRLLLMPSLVVGCACFAPMQRRRAAGAVRIVGGYGGMRNCDRVLELLDEVWRLMDRGDWAAVWDWQAVASNMGWDFACG
jgi:hypothetical protein